MATEVDLPQEAIARYIERRKKDYTDCREALTQGDYALLARVGHQIKGNAVSFGFDELGEIAIQMEDLALKKDAANLEPVLQSFGSYIEKLATP